MIELGKKLDVRVSEIIRKHTGKQDRVQVSSMFGINEYDLKSVVYREHNIKQKQQLALKELIKRAAKSCEDSAIELEILNSCL